MLVWKISSEIIKKHPLTGVGLDKFKASLGDNYRVLKDYKNAEKHYQKASDMIPIRLYPVYLLAKMYEEKGDLKNAKEQAEKLLKMPIKVPSTAVFEMQEEMKNLLEK